jgi:hypothetical protein
MTADDLAIQSNPSLPHSRPNPTRVQLRWTATGVVSSIRFPHRQSPTRSSIFSSFAFAHKNPQSPRCCQSLTRSDVISVFGASLPHFCPPRPPLHLEGATPFCLGACRLHSANNSGQHNLKYPWPQSGFGEQKKRGERYDAKRDRDTEAGSSPRIWLQRSILNRETPSKGRKQVGLSGRPCPEPPLSCSARIISTG